MLFDRLKEKMYIKGPELAFFFDNEQNYQRLVKGTYDSKLPNAFNQTRSLWVFTDDLNTNYEHGYVKKIHHPQFGIVSTDYLGINLSDRLLDLTQEDQNKLEILKTSNKSCDAFIFIDKCSMKNAKTALLKFKASLMHHLTKTGNFLYILP